MMFWRWTLNVAALLLSLWFANLTLFNWWAAGGPPNPHHEVYAFRGQVFFALACLCFIGFGVLLVMNIRKCLKARRARDGKLTKWETRTKSEREREGE
jgi:hypothetical protein